MSYLSASKAAKYCGVSYDTFRRKIAPRVPRYQLTGDGGRFGYSTRDLDEWAKKNVVYPPGYTSGRTKKGVRDLDKKVRANPVARALLERMGEGDAA